jgi:hypothetical protein
VKISKISKKDKSNGDLISLDNGPSNPAFVSVLALGLLGLAGAAAYWWLKIRHK